MSKSRIEHLKKLSAMAVESSKELNKQIDLMGDVVKETLKDAPEDQKSEIEQLQALMTKSFNLAKQGKADQVNDLIKNFRNGRKSNK